MSSLRRLILCVTVILASSCGIKGQPLSPTQVKTGVKKEPLFSLGTDDTVNESTKNKTKKYASISELEQIGSEYSANFGVRNDNLNDVFERIKPKSALIKKQPIIPLRRD